MGIEKQQDELKTTTADGVEIIVIQNLDGAYFEVTYLGTLYCIDFFEGQYEEHKTVQELLYAISTMSVKEIVEIFGPETEPKES